MRMGLIFSGFLHVSLIGFGLFTIAGSQLDRHEIDIEPVSIDLVPIADEMSVREGEQIASLPEPPAPKPTQKPEINQQARHVGDGQLDSAAPLRLEIRPRDVEATPPPTETQQPKTESTPTPSQEIVEPARAETVPVQTEAEPVETASIIPPLPQTAPQPREKPAKLVTSPPRQGEQPLDDIINQSAKLIDRTPTQGGGMRRSERPAGAGTTRTIGDGELRQTIENVIAGCLRQKVQITALSGSQSYNLVVKVHMRLNRDGSVDGVPDLTPSGGDAAEREIAVTQAHAALALCSPFSNLPPERYDDGWSNVILNWRPLN